MPWDRAQEPYISQSLALANQVGTALVLIQHFGPTALDLLVAALHVVVTAARKPKHCHKEHHDPYSAHVDSPGNGPITNWGRACRIQAPNTTSGLVCQFGHGAAGKAKIFPGLRLVRQCAQQISRVIGHDEGNALIAMQTAAQGRDACLRA